MLKKVSKQLLQNIKLFLLIIVGTVSWSWTIVKSGWFYESLGEKGSGMGFWGANGHDGIWHLALIERIAKGSFDNPVYAGESIKNYHLGFDILLAVVHKLTQIPVVNLYFQIFPVFFAISIGILVYIFTLKLFGNKNSALLSVFFTYFGGSFGWVLGRGESTFWAQQAISSLINPPYALSLIVLLAGMIFLLNRKLLITIILFGLLIEIKVYAGVLVIGGLAISAFYGYFWEKDNFIAKLFMGTLLLSGLLFILFQKGSQDLLAIAPLWFLETLMGLRDRLDWQRFSDAMLAYKSGRNYLKMIPAYTVAFIIFLIGNLGVRLVAFSSKPKITSIHIFIYTIIAGGVLIPMIFLQKGTPWNTIQFFYYSLFLTGVLAGNVLTHIRKNKILVIIAMVLLTIPTSIKTLAQVYVPSRPPAFVGEEEMNALGFLKEQPDGVVLTKPFDEFKSKSAESDPPRPLYLYASTAYVSAFSAHQTYLEDEINLDITGFEWQKRRKELLSWFDEKDFQVQSEFLRSRSIMYIYWIKEGQSPLDIEKLDLTNLYENDLVTVYRVN